MYMHHFISYICASCSIHMYVESNRDSVIEDGQGEKMKGSRDSSLDSLGVYNDYFTRLCRIEGRQTIKAYCC